VQWNPRQEGATGGGMETGRTGRISGGAAGRGHRRGRARRAEPVRRWWRTPAWIQIHRGGSRRRREMVGVGGWDGEGPPGEKPRSQPAGGGFRQERCRREAKASSWTTPGEFFTICCCWTTFYDGGGSIRSTAQMGRALPPAEVMGDLPGGALGGRRGGAPWRTTGNARKAGAWVAAAKGLA